MDRITIVTVSYNAEQFIEATMRSVCDQDYPNFEYLVIDGESTDKTVVLAEQIKAKYQNKTGLEIIIQSERDKGIYDAMNKGIDLATGEWILFMNAGDYFPDRSTISKVFSHYDAFKHVNGVYGDTVRIRGDKETFVKGKPLAEIRDGFPLPFCHQSVFVRKNLLQKHHFDLRYTQAGDYNFFVKAFLEGNEFYHVDIVVSRYQMGGISETNNIKHWEEKIQIREENGLEHFSRLSKRLIIWKYTIRQKAKKILPKRILHQIVQ